MIAGRKLAFVGLAASLGVLAIGVARFELPPKTIVLGRQITPLGDQTEVGSFPANMILSPDGKYVIVTNTGFRQQLSVLDSTNGQLVSRLEFNGRDTGGKSSLYFGIAAHLQSDGTTLVAVSRGSQDKVSIYSLSSDGSLTLTRDLPLPKADDPLGIPWHVAGVAWSADGSQVFAVANQSHAFNDFKGSVFTLNLNGGSVVQRDVGSFPLAGVVAPSGELFVANEGGQEVSRLGAGGDQTIRTGEAPTYLSLDHAGKTLFVSNSNSDTVSFVDLATHRVKTVLLRPATLQSIPGATPLGSAISPDDKTLYVAMGDLSAVVVVDVPSARIKGYLPVGWYPTSVAVSNDGRRLFVANAKGVQTENPNGKKVRTWGTYAPNILEGTVSLVDLGQATANLAATTKQVLLNNHMQDRIQFQPKEFVKPKIDHVIYIIKENRTYDQVLGDDTRGNGDASLTLFGRDVTPNQHALADRFALFDNFYVCAEVSADGWNWSTSGMANEYVERNVPYNYSGRGRSYDYEGTNNGSPVSLQGKRDVAEAPGGYIWDAFLKKGLSVRNYGMFDMDADDTKGPDGKPIGEDNQPDKPALVGRTCTDFRIFDLSYADSDAWVKLGLPPTPKQRKAYGSHDDPSRMSAWLREFHQYVNDGNLPNLTLLRLPRNHTAGTAAGLSSPKAMAADNDYAVGQVVEAVSHSKYWGTTAIFVVEDDAQAGTDHVDCHRSPVLVISPYIQKGTIASSFYNTDSVLRTMELLFGIAPHNGYVATAPPMSVFSTQLVNNDAYDAIMPDPKIVSQVNTERDFEAKLSSKLFIGKEDEDTEADWQLNVILWKSIKGVKSPLPKTPGVVWGKP